MAALQLTCQDYNVGWLCALAESEYAAATLMLDTQHRAPNQPPNDINSYTYGSINSHNVVMTCLPPGKPGKVAAHKLVSPLKKSFPHIQIYLFVGIGGGVPRNTNREDPKEDIHLGDVVVGWPRNTGDPAVLQYDFSRDLGDGVYTELGRLATPEDRILSVLSLILRDRKMQKNRFHERLLKLKPMFPRPDLEDKLYESDYKHVPEKDKSRPCSACDERRLVKRRLRPEGVPELIFHLGTILSGDTAMRNAEHRDKTRERFSQYDAICFEMEAAGVQDETRCLVIRGIADYADSHHNYLWQDYAASTAAAFACELLYNIPPSEIEKMRDEADVKNPPNPSQTRRSHHMGPGSVPPQTSAPATTAGSSTFPENTSAGFAEAMHKGEFHLMRRDEKHRAKDLLDAESSFLEARHLLAKLPSLDLGPLLFKVSHKLMVVETQMTYNHRKSLDEREAHLRRAEEYGNDASKAACGLSIARDLSRIKLEQGVVKARGVELKAKRNLEPLEIRMRKEEALETIGGALLELRSSDMAKSKYEDVLKYAAEWQQRLSKV